MEYEILGDTLPVLICRLGQGESMFTQSGGMGWMTFNFKMSTNIKGGVLKGIGRKLIKESFFMTTYTCTYGEGMISFPSRFPGSILAFDLKPGQSIIAQKNAFLCAESSVDVKMYFKPKLLVGLFGGEGFIMQKITGPGKVFLEVDGGSVRHTLQQGETLKVDPGHIATISESVHMKMTFVKGVMNIFFSGEGLFLTELTGPGEIWLQTMPIRNVAQSIAPYLNIKRARGKNANSSEQTQTE